MLPAVERNEDVDAIASDVPPPLHEAPLTLHTAAAAETPAMRRARLPARDGRPVMNRIVCTDPQLASRLRLFFEDLEDGQVISQSSDCSQAPLCRWLDPSELGPAGHVQAALCDAIETLERSRNAFRSREMGQLRQRLLRLLEDLSTPS